MSIAITYSRFFKHSPSNIFSIRVTKLMEFPIFSDPNTCSCFLGFPSGPAASSSSDSLIKHRRHHKRRHHVVSPTPSIISERDQMACNEPLISVPFVSPCGCVLPMKVENSINSSILCNLCTTRNRGRNRHIYETKPSKDNGCKCQHGKCGRCS